MGEEDTAKLLLGAKKVLKQNDRGKYTVPSNTIYPHQWLWDSCFIAIGLSNFNLERAKTEILSLLRGQWANGMLPHMIFAEESVGHWQNRHLEAWINPHAPSGVVTSGITQPPMLAEAVARIGQKMKLPERRSWYAKIMPSLIAYHQWFYKERDLSGSGLICLIHPCESGLDNTPPAIILTRKYAWPLWLRLAEKTGLDKIAELVRRDTKAIPPGQRMTNAEAIAYWTMMRRLKHLGYNSQAILHRPRFALDDLAFNSILVRANSLLQDIASTAGKPLPAKLKTDMAKTESSLELLWDDTDGIYYSRNPLDEKLIEEPTVASLLPLYAGTVPKARAERLVELLSRRKLFKTNWPTPSVPVSSSFFNPINYWQGPTWLNINWLIIDGLQRYDFHNEAKQLTAKSLELVAKSGMNEYFNPTSGAPAGAPNFSWTAALTIDLLNS